MKRDYFSSSFVHFLVGRPFHQTSKSGNPTEFQTRRTFHSLLNLISPIAYKWWRLRDYWTIQSNLLSLPSPMSSFSNSLVSNSSSNSIANDIVDQRTSNSSAGTGSPLRTLDRIQHLRFSEAMESDGRSNVKIVHGEFGYLLEDVPHLSDYLPDLPVSSFWYLKDCLLIWSELVFWSGRTWIWCFLIQCSLGFLSALIDFVAVKWKFATLFGFYVDKVEVLLFSWLIESIWSGFEVLSVNYWYYSAFHRFTWFSLGKLL